MALEDVGDYTRGAYHYCTKAVVISTECFPVYFLKPSVNQFVARPTPIGLPRCFALVRSFHLMAYRATNTGALVLEELLWQ